ncbi:MAG: DegT/DnrJ/EryC1/StrS family aminotransferase [Christensenellaceae bacterium]|jgi:perosamine synthetase
MIRLIKPYISFEDVEQEFREIFDSGILTRGRYSAELPDTLCSYTGAQHAFNATSATTALAAALEVLGIGNGDEVVVADFSFPASANVVEACGAKPVFADVDRETYNMLPAELEKKIGPRTKAVIFVCALGNPTGLAEISSICKAKSIPLINDAACAIGSSENGKMVGNIADIECFSFHPRKLLTSGEGGAILTNNDEYAKKLAVKLAHGAVPHDGALDFITYGYNYRLPELQCLMLIKQIEKLDAIVRERNETQKQYAALLSGAGYVPQKAGANVLHNMQSIVFSVPEAISRDGLIEHLKQQDIESTIGTYCLSACTYYQNKYDDMQPNADWLFKNTITLPCYTDIDVDFVANAILEYR